jgi:Icc-related predicted phosphoesterase
MKLIYAADIHGAFERVKTLLYETVADVYVISGDLIDIPFYNMDSAIRYHELQTYFHGLRGRMGKAGVILEDFVDELLEVPDIPEEVQSQGTTYQQYTIRARRVMQQKYKVLENIISLKQKSRVFCLPGNYDMDLKYTSLHEQDLHLHWYQIANCGSRAMAAPTSGRPESRNAISSTIGGGSAWMKNTTRCTASSRRSSPTSLSPTSLPMASMTASSRRDLPVPQRCAPSATTTP